MLGWLKRRRENARAYERGKQAAKVIGANVNGWLDARLPGLAARMRRVFDDLLAREIAAPASDDPVGLRAAAHVLVFQDEIDVCVRKLLDEEAPAALGDTLALADTADVRPLVLAGMRERIDEWRIHVLLDAAVLAVQSVEAAGGDAQPVREVVAGWSAAIGAQLTRDIERGASSA